MRSESCRTPALLLLLALGCAGAPAPKPPTAAAPGEPPRRVAELDAKLAGLERHTGLFELVPDPVSGKLYAILPRPDASGSFGEYLYVNGIRTGLG
ncbi:MAG: hypothetical protein KDB94_09365, partial [Acidobacteria bacterium]|nr:hypothetical protein [Acidobacteriota bacterium]